MKALAAAALALSFAAPLAAQGDLAMPGKERVILHTNMGDIALAFFPKAAPKHVEQILKLMRLGVYNGVNFHRVEPNFVIQIANAESRSVPMTPAQAAAIKPLKAEFNAIKHAPGILSMARYDNQPDSATTSFSILLTNAPHLDNQYTVFGRVEAGWDVVEAIRSTPRDSSNQPLRRVEVMYAEVLPSAEELAKRPLIRAAPQAPVQQEAARPGPAGAPSQAVAAVLLVMMALGLGVFWAAARYPGKPVASLGLLTVLVGFFGLFVHMAPAANTQENLAIALFIGLLSLFKLMNRFESPV